MLHRGFAHEVFVYEWVMSTGFQTVNELRVFLLYLSINRL